tara:strand:+ start:1268 stop:1864 length:597 start_codon:yes stop_codon:yes gene_type:complete
MTKLHLGCASNILDGWINIDRSDSKYKIQDETMDITKKWSNYDNKSVDYIYTEHVIEHFSYNDGKFMFTECYRTLKTGGRIRVATPDLKFLIDLYDSDKTKIQQEYIKYSSSDVSFAFVPFEIDTFVINNFVRDWDHTFIYDEKTLRDLLVSIGFSDVKKHSVNKSNVEEFKNLENHGNRMSSEFYELETFILEAKKL